MSLQSKLFIEKNKIDEFSVMKVTKTGLKTILKKLDEFVTYLNFVY